MDANNPLIVRKRQREAAQTFADKLDRIAASFMKAVDPLRLALIAMIEAGADGWADALYRAGPKLPEIDDVQWSDSRGGLVAMTRKGLLELVQAAKAKDRKKFNQWLNVLNDDPETNARLHSGKDDVDRPEGELPALAAHFIQLRYRIEMDAIRPRVLKLISEAGLPEDDVPFDHGIWSQIAQRGVTLSPQAERILKFSIDEYSVVVFPFGPGNTLPTIDEPLFRPFDDGDIERSKPPTIQIEELADVEFVDCLNQSLRNLTQEIRAFRRLDASKNLDDVRRQNGLSLIRLWTEFVTRFSGDRLQALMDRHGIPADIGNWRAQFRMELHFEHYMTTTNDIFLAVVYRRANAVRMLCEHLRDLPVKNHDDPNQERNDLISTSQLTAFAKVCRRTIQLWQKAGSFPKPTIQGKKGQSSYYSWQAIRESLRNHVPFPVPEQFPGNF